jgi:integrase
VVPKRKFRLTKTALQAQQREMIDDGESRRIVWDEIPGFGARITGERISLFVNYRAPNGIERRLDMGTLDEMTVESGRKRAADYRVEAKAGRDPIQAIRALRKDDVEDKLTLRRAVDRWKKANASKWKPRTAADYAGMLDRELLPALGDRELAGIKKGEWAAHITDVTERSAATGALLYRVVRSCLSWCEDCELIERIDLPRGKRIAPTVAPRERVVTDEELKAIWTATEHLSPRSAGLARWLILSAVRRGAGEQLRYDWISDAAVTVPASVMKGRRDHVVPLSIWSRAQLGQVLEQRSTKLPFVFSDGPNRPNRSKKVLELLQKHSGVNGWSWHDLRRSFRSWCSRVAIPRDHAEEALAHRSHRTKLDVTYDRHTYVEEAGRALLAWQEHVRAIVEGAAPRNVVSIQSRGGVNA